MARVKRPPEEVLLERTMLIIRKAGLDCGLRTDSAIADVCGIPKSTFCKNSKKGGWTWAQMTTMVSLLHIKPEQAAQMLGAK